MEALIILVIIAAGWLLANRLGLLDAATAVIQDGGSMAVNASTVARVKSDVKRDKYLASAKVDVKQRVQAELNLKKHNKFSTMSIEELEAELSRMTAQPAVVQQ